LFLNVSSSAIIEPATFLSIDYLGLGEMTIVELLTLAFGYKNDTLKFYFISACFPLLLLCY
jgi:hypothetical protein